jgi:ABC-type sugar transport system ATPase subunit
LVVSPSSTVGPVVQLSRVSKSFGDVKAVHDVSLEIQRGEFFSLLGPSGCGKTTTLRLLAGFEEPDHDGGEVRLLGEVVNRKRPYERKIAMVFQSYALFPHLSVQRNVAFGLEQRKTPKREIAERVRRALAMVRLEPDTFAGRMPGQLSGGQRQRVALARALVLEPDILLLDEPLGAIDLKLRKEMQLELKSLNKQLGTTFVYVTHDQVEAMTMAKRVAVMNEGVLQQVGPPTEVYDRPANLFVARFIGNPPMNTLAGTVEEGVVTVAGGTLAAPTRSAALPDEIVVGIRPERLAIGPADGPGVRVKLRVLELLGHEQLLVCDSEDGTSIIARLDPDEEVPTEGSTFTLVPDPDHVHLFDPTTTERID